jgi:hypothetical protein
LDDLSQSDALSENRQITLILRLLLDRKQNLLHGSLVDVTGLPIGQFSDWDSLVEAIQNWLSRPNLPGE